LKWLDVIKPLARRSSDKKDEMDTLIPAMIGFVGVLVGALITTGANYLLAVRKEKAEAARDKLFRTNELKTAARLIADDLFTAQTAVMEFVDNKRWAPTAARNFPLEAWQKNREVLARELPLEDWNAVEIAVWAVERFRTLAPVPRSNDALAEIGKPLLNDIKAGLEVLIPYM
jgi:hypothetical protein